MRRITLQICPLALTASCLHLGPLWFMSKRFRGGADYGEERVVLMTKMERKEKKGVVDSVAQCQEHGSTSATVDFGTRLWKENIGERDNLVRIRSSPAEFRCNAIWYRRVSLQQLDVQGPLCWQKSVRDPLTFGTTYIASKHGVMKLGYTKVVGTECPTF
jgi:hypothetical protein